MFLELSNYEKKISLEILSVNAVLKLLNQIY